MKHLFSKKSHTEELPPALQKQLNPPPDVLNSGKKKFLAAFDTSPLSHTNTNHTAAIGARASSFSFILKFGIGALAVIAIAIAGTSAYADTTNVPITSPLYPLKRLGESVQLALTPTSEKAQVQATFAGRRASEIVQLQQANPSSTKIGALVKDLDDDVSSSLTTASDTNLKANSLSDVCTTLFAQAGFGIATHQNLLARFNAKCGNEINSSTVSSTLNASDTLNILLPLGFGSSTNHGRHRGQDGDGQKFNDDSAVSSTIEVSSTIMIGDTPTSSPHNNSSSKSRFSSWFPHISF